MYSFPKKRNYMHTSDISIYGLHNPEDGKCNVFRTLENLQYLGDLFLTVWTPAVLAEVSHVFPWFLQESAETVSP
jgi:hypothetical protein